MRTRFTHLLTTAAVVFGGLLFASAPADASAATCAASGPDDIDGSGQGDLMVGVSFSNEVDIRYDGVAGKVQILHGYDLDPSPYGTRFGAATSVAKDANGCSMVVIGAPYYGVSGEVFVAPVVDGRVTATGVIKIVSPDPTDRRFGNAVAAFGRDIWVGAPGAAVDGVRRAGAVFHYRLTDSGGARLIDRFTERSPGIPGGPEVDDAFGTVLSLDDAGAVAIGEPDEDVGRQTDAGTVTVIRTDHDSGAFSSALTISQNSPGITGAAEAGDGFGRSLSMIETGLPDTTLPDVLAVGVPGEGIGDAARTGSVLVLDLVPGHVSQRAGFSQDSAGVPGDNESGDGFGRSVVFGSFTGGFGDGYRALDLAVGVPYENSGTGRVLIAHGFGAIADYKWSNLPVTAPANSHTGRGLGPVSLPDSGGSRIAVARPEDSLDNMYDKAGSLVLLDDHGSTSPATFFNAEKFAEYGVPANIIATQTVTAH